MIYKTKDFVSRTKKESLSDADLINACREMSAGLYDSDLGGNVYKKRVAMGRYCVNQSISGRIFEDCDYLAKILVIKKV